MTAQPQRPPHAHKRLAPDGYHAPYPAPYAPSPLALRAPNRPGIAGLVLGCVALGFAVIPVVGLVAWVLWPIALSLSAVGVGRANRHLATNRNTALAGLWVSITAAAVCVVWLVLMVSYGASF